MNERDTPPLPPTAELAEACGPADANGWSLRALRGATTVSANTAEAIGEAVAELIEELVQRNGLEGDKVLSVTFSVTADLDA